MYVPSGVNVVFSSDYSISSRGFTASFRFGEQDFHINFRARLHDTAMAPVPSIAPFKMGTEPNIHGTPSTAPTLSTAMAPVPSRVYCFH